MHSPFLSNGSASALTVALVAEKQAKNKAIVLDSDDEAPPPTARKPARTKRSSPRFMGDTEDSPSSDSSSDSSGSPDTDSTSSGGDSFIVEEENPDGNKFVEEFRESIRGQMQGLRYYLKTYLLYLVHLVIDPDRDWLAADEEFRTAVHRINEHLAGHLNSLVTSSAWKVRPHRLRSLYSHADSAPLSARSRDSGRRSKRGRAWTWKS